MTIFSRFANKAQFYRQYINRIVSRRSVTNSAFNQFIPVERAVTVNVHAHAVTGCTVATSVMIFMVGLSYISVPLYKVFCQKYGWQGTIDEYSDEKLKELIKYRKERMLSKEDEKKIMIKFETRTDPALPWKFEPVQNYVVVAPGETALAFFSVFNYSNRPITAVSTYGVIPFKMGPYFVKVQCFCFEEQRVRAKEKVDMPVLFYIDPEIYNDESMTDVNDIILSYNFFEVEAESGPVEEDDDFEWDEDKVHEQMKRGSMMKGEVFSESESQYRLQNDSFIGMGFQYAEQYVDNPETKAALKEMNYNPPTKVHFLKGTGSSDQKFGKLKNPSYSSGK